MDATSPSTDMNRYAAAHDARVNELLKANTDYMEEARAARRDSDKLQRALSQIVERIGIDEIERAEKAAQYTLYGDRPSKAMLDVFGERRKQRLKHGYSAENDDAYKSDELLRSAISRLLRRIADWNQALKPKVLAVADAIKPFTEVQASHRDALIVSAALIIAEVERYDRMIACMDADGASPFPTPNTPVIANTPRVGRCNAYMRQQRPPPLVMPRTCAECGLGPCKFGLN